MGNVTLPTGTLRCTISLDEAGNYTLVALVPYQGRKVRVIGTGETLEQASAQLLVNEEAEKRRLLHRDLAGDLEF